MQHNKHNHIIITVTKSFAAYVWRAELTQRESAEKCVYSRIGHVINTFHELLQTALPVGPCVDAMMRIVYRVYLLLTSLVKWVSAQFNPLMHRDAKMVT